MDFQIINTSTGNVVNCDFSELSQNLSVNCEILRIKGDKHEAVGFVSYNVLSHFVCRFAENAYQIVRNKDKRILAAIDAFNKHHNNLISKSELNTIFKAAQDAAVEIPFTKTTVAENVAMNNVLLAIAACVEPLGIMDKLPSYCLSSTEDKEKMKIEQSSYVLKYFDCT